MEIQSELNPNQRVSDGTLLMEAKKKKKHFPSPMINKDMAGAFDAVVVWMTVMFK